MRKISPFPNLGVLTPKKISYHIDLNEYTKTLQWENEIKKESESLENIENMVLAFLITIIAIFGLAFLFVFFICIL